MFVFRAVNNVALCFMIVLMNIHSVSYVHFILPQIDLALNGVVICHTLIQYTNILNTFL